MSIQKKGNGLAVLFGVFLSLALVGLLETFFYFLNQSSLAKTFEPVSYLPHLPVVKMDANGPHGKSVSFESLPKVEKPAPVIPGTRFVKLDLSEIMPNGILIDGATRVQPSFEGRGRLWIASTREKIYDVNYMTDEYGRRATPVDPEGTRKKHLIVLGCSLVFGVGVEQDQTLPAVLTTESSDHRIYNQGVPGASLGHFLLLDEKKLLWNGVSESEGAAVYVYFDDHLNRLIGNMATIGLFGEHLPFVTQTESGSYKVKGTFGSAQPTLTALYKMLYHSQILTFFGINLPWRYSSEQLDMFVKVLDQIKKSYLERFPGQKFYIASFPGIQSASMPYLKPYLEKAGIDYLDYSQFHLPLFSEKPVRFKYDDHPTPEANRIWGAVLARDLQISRAFAK